MRRKKGFKAQDEARKPQKANVVVHLLFSPSVLQCLFSFFSLKLELPFCPYAPFLCLMGIQDLVSDFQLQNRTAATVSLLYRAGSWIGSSPCAHRSASRPRRMHGHRSITKHRHPHKHRHPNPPPSSPVTAAPGVGERHCRLALFLAGRPGSFCRRASVLRAARLARLGMGPLAPSGSVSCGRLLWCGPIKQQGAINRRKGSRRKNEVSHRYIRIVGYEMFDVFLDNRKYKKISFNYYKTKSQNHKK